MGRNMIWWSGLMALCGKHARQLSRKLSCSGAVRTITHRANSLMQRKKTKESPEDFGDGGIWQRSILMGDKCEPLDFSGVIYYDSHGKKLNQLPLRSPRASPSPRYLHAPKQLNPNMT